MASASFPPPPPSSSPAMTPSPASFSHSIPTKLTNSSYILWCNQVQPVIKGHGLSYFLVAPIIPSRFDTVADCNAGIVLKEYLNWEKQDQFLLSWLQSTISDITLPHRVGCNTSWHLWEKLHTHFHSIAHTKKRQLRMDLRNVSLDNRKITDYLLHIQTLTDSLTSIGDFVSQSERVDIILEGLPMEYESSVTFIYNKSKPMSVDDVESLLLDHQSLI